MRLMRATCVAVLALTMALASFSAIAEEGEPKTEGSATADPERAAGAESKAEPGDDADSVSARPPQASSPLIYRPPKPGKPVRTVGGGSRGTTGRVPKLFALTPEHVGLTISDQPSLFWFVDRVPESWRVEFALLDEDGVEPLVETVLAMPQQAGIQRIRLEDHGVLLAPGKEYEWSVTIVVDPAKRAKDIVAVGWIDRVGAKGQLTSQLANLEPAATAEVYAEAGLWYDTLAAISDQIDQNPGDSMLLRRRSDVLRQVGLLEAAEAGS